MKQESYKDIPLIIIILSSMVVGLFFIFTEPKEEEVEYPITGLKISRPRCKIN